MDLEGTVGKIFTGMMAIAVGFCIVVLILIMVGAISSGLKEKEKETEYLKECERKAILYDYIIENKEETMCDFLDEEG